MLVSDVSGVETLYMLLTDAPLSCDKVNISTGNGYSNLSVNSRGAFISVPLEGAVTSLLNAKLPAFTSVEGWNASKGTAYDSSRATGPCYMSSASDYSDKCFAGPQNFIALTPKKISMADYGIYISSAGSSTSGIATRTKIKNGKAVFDLASITFTSGKDDSEESTYGWYGSISGNCWADVINTTTY